MDLEGFIYEFNLVSTLTVKDVYDWACVLNNNTCKDIDYSNSISLYHLVESFYKLYILYKIDYDKLAKLNLGKKEKIISFNSYKKGDNETLVIDIDEPNRDIFDTDNAILYLYKKENNTYNYISNGLYPYDNDYCTKELIIDLKIMKDYLDFGRKYGLLIDSYNFLYNKFIFGNGTSLIFSKINGEMEDGISSFEITIGNVYFNREDYINVVFKFGDNLLIDYDNSIVKLGDYIVDNKKEVIDMLINNIYINRDKLSDMYCKSYTKRLIK